MKRRYRSLSYLGFESCFEVGLASSDVFDVRKHAVKRFKGNHWIKLNAYTILLHILMSVLEI